MRAIRLIVQPGPLDVASTCVLAGNRRDAALGLLDQFIDPPGIFLTHHAIALRVEKLPVMSDFAQMLCFRMTQPETGLCNRQWVTGEALAQAQVGLRCEGKGEVFSGL